MVSVSFLPSMAAFGEELGCSSTLNPPQIPGGAREGVTPPEHPDTGTWGWTDGARSI